MAKFGLAVKLAALTILVMMAANLSVAQVLSSSESSPYPISSYGVARLSATKDFALGGFNFRIKLTSDSAAPFFAVRVAVILNRPLEDAILLESLTVDDLATITLSNAVSPSVVIIPAGAIFGEIITSLPDSVSVMLVKEPLGNLAFPAEGGDAGGLMFTLRFSGGSLIGTTATVIAIVTAPVDYTVAMQLS